MTDLDRRVGWADFPTDEDVEIAARAIEQAGWNSHIDDATWAAVKSNHSGEYAEMLVHARAALVAVSESRRHLSVYPKEAENA